MVFKAYEVIMIHQLIEFSYHVISYHVMLISTLLLSIHINITMNRNTQNHHCRSVLCIDFDGSCQQMNMRAGKFPVGSPPNWVVYGSNAADYIFPTITSVSLMLFSRSKFSDIVIKRQKRWFTWWSQKRLRESKMLLIRWGHLGTDVDRFNKNKSTSTFVNFRAAPKIDFPMPKLIQQINKTVQYHAFYPEPIQIWY